MGNSSGRSSGPSGSKPARGVELYSRLETGEAGTGAAQRPPEESRPMTLMELIVVLRPYFWPDEGTDGAIINRCRSSATWLMVALSKTANLISPYYLTTATNSLANKDYRGAMFGVLMYCVFRFASSLFKGTDLYCLHGELGI
jgi:hypothetical protein